MRSRLALVVAAVLVLGAALGGGLWWREREAALDRGAEHAVSAYVAAWNAKDMSVVPFSENGAAEQFAEVIDGLGDAPVRVTSRGVARDGEAATTDLSVTWTLPGKVAWTYTLPARVLRSGERWVVGSPERGSRWHPQLGPDETFELERTSGTRGDLLDRSGEPLMPLGTVHSVQIDPVNATPASAAALEAVVDAAAGTLTAALAKATASGSKAPIPVITYREARLRSAQGAAPGARRCHHPDVGAAARQDADLRSAAPRHLRRGDGRDDRGRRRALRRRGPGRPQRPPGTVRLPARRSHRVDRHVEWRHVALRPGADERHRRAHDAGPSGAGGGRGLAGRRRAGRPRRTGCRRRADRRGPGRCERPDERLRPCHHRPVPTGIDLQGRDDVRLPHPRHHGAHLTSTVPANGHGRRARVPQLRG